MMVTVEHQGKTILAQWDSMRNDIFAGGPFEVIADSEDLRIPGPKRKVGLKVDESQITFPPAFGTTKGGMQ